MSHDPGYDEIIRLASARIKESPVHGPEHWTEVTDWWRHPALAYLKGLQDGARLQAEREDTKLAEMARAIVKDALEVSEMVESRRRIVRRGTHRTEDYRGRDA